MRTCVIIGHVGYLSIRATNREGEVDSSNHTLGVRVMARWQQKARGSVHVEVSSR